MQVIALLRTLFELINRALDKLDEFDKLRKQLRDEERRASVQANPDKAFADLFGKPDNVQLHPAANERTVSDAMRADLSTIIVDKNGKRNSDHPAR